MAVVFWATIPGIVALWSSRPSVGRILTTGQGFRIKSSEATFSGVSNTALDLRDD